MSVEALGRDLRHALRRLLASPGFTAVAVLSLALGIAANTTAFGLVSAIFLRPLEFAAEDRLVDVSEWSATKLCAGCGVGTSYPGFLDWRAQAKSFAGMAAYRQERLVVSGVDAPERVTGALATAALFPLLGVRPEAGRTFAPAEDRVGGEPVVVIGHDFWARHFGADPSAVGRTVKINGEPHTIVGVMPARFRFPESAELWVPLVPRAHADARDDRSLGVVARLAAGVSSERADAEMRLIAARLERQYPDAQREWTARVESLRAELTKDVGMFFVLLLGVVALVLLIACANLAGLLLARAVAREREMAIRAAMGASRARLVWLLLTESLMVALLGGAAGLLLSLWAMDLAASALRPGLPAWVVFALDARVLAFCVGLVAATAVAFGLVPALRASRPALHDALKAGSLAATGGRGRSRLRDALVVGELALTLVLLSGAGLLTKTFVRLSAPPAAYREERLLMADLGFDDARYADSTQIALAAAQIVARLDRQPNVRAAMSHTEFIAGFGGQDQPVTVEGRAGLPAGASPRFFFAVTPGYFGALGLRLVQGRDLSWRDGAGAPPVAVINEPMARRIWPGESALGKRVKLGPATSPRPWLTVIGVVADADSGERSGRPAGSFAYVPLAQSPGRPAGLVVRTASDAAPLARVIRAEVRAVDPDLPVENIRTAARDRAQRFGAVRAVALVLSSFAGFAVLLAAIGVYGVTAYAVGQRTRELSIRMALGALRADVALLVLRHGAALALVGIVLGLAGAAALTRLLRSVLFGMSPTDPAVLATVTLLLAALTMAASVVPARRATRVDPMIVLRSE